MKLSNVCNKGFQRSALNLFLQTLYVANIGDSGFTLVRDGNVVAKSTPMQREFNFPYQIGTDSDNPSIAEVSIRAHESVQKKEKCISRDKWKL